jgi:hypothetical protein
MMYAYSVLLPSPTWSDHYGAGVLPMPIGPKNGFDRHIYH